MSGVHDADNRYLDVHAVVPHVSLHSVQAVDEYFIAGKIVTEVVFRPPVTVIVTM